MITISQGLVNSMMVLSLLQGDEALKDINIYVECFQNGREKGFTFTFNLNGKKHDRRTYCVYEHRNSDSIIVNHKDNWSSFSGDIPYMADSKWEYDESFEYGNFYDCFKFLKDKFIKEAIKTK